jgi:hypothetical protein
MKGVFFEPWVGKKYFKAGFEGIKILVLGEAHWCTNSNNCCEYCGSPKTCPLTNDASKRFINYKKKKGKVELWMPTWTKFINVFNGKKVNNDDVINFWESIIFYDYVQRPMLKSRISPSKEDFINGKIGFEGVCKKYTPDLIIVWGKRLWGKLPDTGRCGTKCIINKGGGYFYFYKYGKKEIPAYCIPHPSSSAFNYDTTKYLKRVIHLIKTIKKKNK